MSLLEIQEAIPVVESTVPAASSLSLKHSLSLKQAAKDYPVTVWFLRSSVWSGKLDARLSGKQLIVLRTDLERFLEELPLVRSGPNHRAQKKKKRKVSASPEATEARS